jgi:hypothetical protein
MKIKTLEVYQPNKEKPYIYRVGKQDGSLKGGECTSIQEVTDGYVVNYGEEEKQKITNMPCVAIWERENI